jgi:hypothetical protein
MLRINKDSLLLTNEQVIKYEAYYNASYICDTSAEIDGEWLNSPSSLFFNNKENEFGTRYMSLYRNDLGHFMTADGSPALVPIYGIVYNNVVYFSRYKDDLRILNGTGLFVCGGRSNFQTVIGTTYVTININGKDMVIDDEQGQLFI